MKTQRFLAGFFLAITLVAAGCGKKGPPAPSAPEINGVKVDMPALQAAFVGTQYADLQAAINDVSSDIRYGQYMKAMQDLDKVLTNPALTDPQKKIVTQVMDQLKEVINKAGPGR
jgi:hypothetical protein